MYNFLACWDVRRHYGPNHPQARLELHLAPRYAHLSSSSAWGGEALRSVIAFALTANTQSWGGFFDTRLRSRSQGPTDRKGRITCRLSFTLFVPNASPSLSSPALTALPGEMWLYRICTRTRWMLYVCGVGWAGGGCQRQTQPAKCSGPQCIRKSVPVSAFADSRAPLSC